ncbi:hypothetical protein S40288_08127 [Stachybotrys chartarum IBT 40288]|nr:hypothetical protein S40288_08127 [Stachybotrys chartarum IBT 40288]
MSGINKASGKPAPPKRNSEARKEQNRLSSRNYRQKRKQKLALLDSLLDVSEPAPSTQSTAADRIAGAPPVSLPVRQPSAAPEDSSLTRDGWSTDLVPAELPSAWASSSHCPPVPPVADVQLGLDAIAAWDSLGSLELPPSSFSCHESPLPLVETGNINTVNLGGDRQRSKTQGIDPLFAALGSIQNLSVKQKRDLLRHLQKQVLDSSPEDSSSSTSSEDDPADTWLPVRQKKTLSPEANRLQIEARRFAEFVERQTSGKLSPAQLTRVFSAEASFFAAIFANCYALGMADVEPLMDDDGVSIFSLGPDTGYETSQLPFIRSKFSSLTTDLRPIDLQLTVGHHPYIDIFPYRGFREKALKALAHNPPLFDENEMCRDLTSRGGMVCWGSQSNSMGMEAGVPWDVRSWEPQEWFLKKYWFLVGDWEDEMWASARWWHKARGEKMIT